MSVILISEAWDSAIIKPLEMYVLITLADQANDEGLCWPRIETVAEKTRLHVRSVQKIIKRLEKDCHLHRDFQRGHSNLFHIHPRREATPAEGHPGPRPPTPVSTATTGGGPRPPRTVSTNRKGIVMREQVAQQPVFPPDYDDSKKSILTEWWNYKRQRDKKIYEPPAWDVVLRVAAGWSVAVMAKAVENAIVGNYPTFCPELAAADIDREKERDTSIEEALFNKLPEPEPTWDWQTRFTEIWGIPAPPWEEVRNTCRDDLAKDYAERQKKEGGAAA
jgi:hypothetical protein